MNFDEWMKVSEQAMGEKAMGIMEQFFLNKISLDDCVEQVSKAMTQEDKYMLDTLVETVRK